MHQKLQHIFKFVFGILILLQILCVIPSGGANITVSPTTVHSGDQVTISFHDVPNGSLLKLQLEGDIEVPEGTNFSFESRDIVVPFILDGARFSGTLTGAIDNTLTVELNDIEIVRRNQSVNSYITLGMPLPDIEGTIDLIRLNGTAHQGPAGKPNHLVFSSEITGIKQGPDDSQVTFTVHGIDSGQIDFRLVENNTGGEMSNLTFTPETSAAARAAGSIVVGAVLGLLGAAAASPTNIIGIFFKNSSEYLKGFFGENVFERFSEYEAGKRGIQIRQWNPALWGFSHYEIVVGILGSFLIGIATLLAFRMPFTIQNIIVYGLVAGVIVTAHEMGHRFAAHRHAVKTEVKFWDLGAVIMFLTGWFTGNVFAQPHRTVFEEDESRSHRQEAMIMLAGPSVSLALAGVSVLFILSGGVLAEIGSLALMLNLLLATYHMMPFTPMDGKAIFVWNKAIWAMVFVPILALYLIMYLI